MKYWNLDIIDYRVIGASYWMEMDLEMDPVLQIVQKIPENHCPCLHLSIGQVLWLNEL